MKNIGTGIVSIVFCLIAVLSHVKLYNSPQSLEIGSARYRGIKNRMRRWPRNSKEGELSANEIRSYAKINIVCGSVIVTLGFLLILLTIAYR
jgi:hypothetical protein